MKKITLMLAFILLACWQSIGQVQVGTGTTTANTHPISSCYGYSYSQQIYLASDIDASGSITSLSFYLDASTSTADFNDSNAWTVFIGHTTKTEFSSTTDWETLANLSQVFTGTVTFPAEDNWFLLTLDTPFAYNGTDNLVVGVDENQDSYDCTMNWRKTDVTGDRAISYSSDSVNPDPTTPPAGALVSLNNNIIFGGIQQACPVPTALTASNITTTNVDLGWTVGNTETAWNVEYGEAGFVQGSGTIFSQTPDNPYNLTGLNSGTSYQFYVQAYCGAGDESSWVGPFDFATLCDTALTPYIQNFENAGSIPNCWSSTSSTTQNWSFATVPTNGNSYSDHTSGSGYFAFVDGSTTTTTTDATLESGEIDASGLTTPYLQFYVYHFMSSGTASNKITVEVWDGALWNEVYMDDNGDVDDWELVGVDLSTLTITGNIKVRFVVDTLVGSNFYNDIGLDDFSISELPLCFAPVNVSASNITLDTADLSWSSGGTETDWEYSLLLASDPAPTTGTASTVTTFSASGLTPNTDYVFYVKSICGGDSTNFSALPFSTLAYGEICESAIEVTALPYTTTDDTANYGDNYSGSPGASGCGTTSTYLNGDDVVYSYTATADGTINVALSALGSTYSGAFVYTDCADIGSACAVGFGNGSSSADYNFDVAVTAGTTYYVVISTWATPQSTTYTLDITEILCANPSGLAVSNLGLTSADFNWVAGGAETNWEYALLLATDPAPTTGTAIAATTYSDTGLTASTDYVFYVRADCTGGTFSDFISIPFTTLSSGSTCEVAIDVPALPYTTTDDTANYGDNYSGSPGTSGCGTTSSYLNGDDVVYSYTATVDGTINVALSALGSTYSGAFVYTDCADIGIACTAGFGNGSSTSDYDFDVSVASGTTYYVVISTYATPQSTTYTLDITEVLCADPTTLAVSNVTTTSADLEWTGGTETIWNIELVDVTAGGTQTMIATYPGVTTNPFSVSGLVAENDYEFYVQADCGTANGVSMWTGPFAFTTPCEAINTYPSTTDFTNNPATACWTEAGSGEVADGPTGASSDWRDGRAYEDFDGNTINSNAINLYFNTDREWLISPVYDLSTSTDQMLKVNVAVTNYSSSSTPTTVGDTMGSDDEVQLLMTIDNGATWTNLTTWNVGNQPSVNGTEFLADLAAVSGNVQFALWASDGTVNDSEDYDFHVGEFEITDSTLSTSSFNTENNFSYYPNPVENTLSLKGIKNIQNIAVLNMLGQEVLRVAPNAINSEVDMSNLQSGAYFVKVTIENATKTIKIIKE